MRAARVAHVRGRMKALTHLRLHTSHRSWHWFSFRSQDSLQGSRHCEKETGVRSSKVTTSKTVFSITPPPPPPQQQQGSRLPLLQVPDIKTSKRAHDLLLARTRRRVGEEGGGGRLHTAAWTNVPVLTVALVLAAVPPPPGLTDERLINDTLASTTLGFPF